MMTVESRPRLSLPSSHQGARTGLRNTNSFSGEAHSLVLQPYCDGREDGRAAPNTLREPRQAVGVSGPVSE
jgi:hypothetical protein